MIAESLRDYEDVLRRPIHPTHYIATLALVGIYGTTIWSWLGWHRAHERYPYRIAANGVEQRSERWRFYADLGIVIAYAYTLAQVRPTVEHPKENIVWLLAGYPLIIALYAVENHLRRRTYGYRVRRRIPLATALATFVTLTLVYLALRHGCASRHQLALNITALSLVVVVMFAYRWFNDYYKAKYVDRFTVGVDLDGVIADQVSGVLARIKESHGVELRYEDLTEFRLPIGDTDLAEVIKIAQRDDPRYLVGMAVFSGVREALAAMRKHARLVIITARPKGTRPITRRWLERNRIVCDRLINGQELKKSRYDPDVLIDDYTENIREYLEQSDGLAILIDRPWNQADRHRLEPWQEGDRLRIVEQLSDAVETVERFRALRAEDERDAPAGYGWQAEPPPA